MNPFYPPGQHSGTVTPCFVSSLLEEYCNPDEQPNAAEDEEEIKAVAGTLYSSMTTFIHLSGPGLIEM